jgi:hypothetical protein
MCRRGWNKTAGRRLFRSESLDHDKEVRQGASEGNHDVADLQHHTHLVDSPLAGGVSNTAPIRVSLRSARSLPLESFSRPR